MPPISKDEDGIPQYVRARLTVLTLLLKKLEPSSYISYNQFLKGIAKFEKTKKETEILSLLALCTLAVYCDSLIHKDPLISIQFWSDYIM